MTTLDFTADPISSLTSTAHTFGAREAATAPTSNPWICLFTREGADACGILQGQMTADITAWKSGSCFVSALCNPKGRVIASFDIARFGDNLFGLIVANHLAEVVKTTLSRYIMRSKVSITRWPDLAAVCLVPVEDGLEAGKCTVNDAGEFCCRPTWLPEGDASLDANQWSRNEEHIQRHA